VVAVEGAGAAAAEVAVVDRADRFGLGWRPALAVDLYRCLDRIDVLEFIVDDWLDAGAQERASLRSWCRKRPTHLHGVGLGLASTVPVDPARLEKLARLVAAMEPEQWSEHLSFVRAGGHEIGHLAAPPRSPASVAGACANIERATTIIGRTPLMENIATLIDPPGSTLDECAWITAIIRSSGAGFLIDLHNLHANAVNFGYDARAALDALPLEHAVAVHLSGGRWIGRVLDDHLHDPPDAVYDLLGAVAERCPGPLDVIIERDGNYPAIEVLCDQFDRARACVAAGRQRREKP